MQKLLSIGNIFTTLFMVAAIAALSLFSCKKSSQPPAANAKFASDWIGSTVCWYSDSPDTTFTPNVTEYIGTGADGNLITIGWSFGYFNCYKAVPVVGNVSNYNFSIAAQNFSDNCGVGYIISGNGALSATGTLTMTTTVSGVDVATCKFTGVKD